MENETIANIVSVETGEKLGTLKAGDKIVHAKNNKFLEKYDINFNKEARFVRLFDEVLDELSKRLTLPEFRFAVRLARHVSYDDCILRTNGHGNGKFLTIKDISELFGENYKTTCRIMKSLVSKGVLGKHQTGCVEDPSIELKCYTCNPYIYMRGTKVDKTIIGLFKDSGWKEVYITEDKQTESEF